MLNLWRLNSTICAICTSQSLLSLASISSMSGVEFDRLTIKYSRLLQLALFFQRLTHILVSSCQIRVKLNSPIVTGDRLRQPFLPHKSITHTQMFRRFRLFRFQRKCAIPAFLSFRRLANFPKYFRQIPVNPREIRLNRDRLLIMCDRLLPLLLLSTNATQIRVYFRKIRFNFNSLGVPVPRLFHAALSL